MTFYKGVQSWISQKFKNKMKNKEDETFEKGNYDEIKNNQDELINT